MAVSVDTPVGDVDRLSWTGTSTLWHKRYRVDVHADHVEFHAIDDAGFRVPCWGARRVDGAIRAPRVILVPGRTAEDALRRYVAVLRDAGLVPSPRASDRSNFGEPPD